MTFANGKSHEDALSLSETHRIAFQKGHIDFFMISIDHVGDNEVTYFLADVRLEYLTRLSTLKFAWWTDQWSRRYQFNGIVLGLRYEISSINEMIGTFRFQC